MTLISSVVPRRKQMKSAKFQQMYLPDTNYALIIKRQGYFSNTKTDLRKIKKLGTIFDEGAEISRLKHLTQIAMSKFRRIWKNKFINVKTKMCIYNVYATSILLYNCSTWFELLLSFVQLIFDV